MKKEKLNILEIDRFNLPEEWAAQPNRYWGQARKLAELRKEHAYAEAKLDLVTAQLSKKIRKNPQDYEVEKITETLVEQTITLQSEYQLALKQIIEIKFEIDQQTAVVAALDHRKKALESETSLLIGEFYSAPKAAPEAKEKWQEMEREQAFSNKKTRRTKKN